MKFETGEIVTLGATRYVIVESLASGAVADVYKAAFEIDPTALVVIKGVRADAVLQAAQEREAKVAGLRREGAVLAQLNQAEDPAGPGSADPWARYQWARETARRRRIVALIDHGDITPTQPFVVQELAPPEFRRFPISGPADELRLWRIMQAVTEAMVLTHRQDMALRDFEPRTKWDRIRLRSLDEGSGFELKLIDWNVTGGREDIPQDLFFWGQHLYFFFLGQHVELDPQTHHPPVNLGVGIAAWEALTAGTRQILQRLLHRDLGRRYSSAAELGGDLGWWVDVLERAYKPNGIRQLDDRLWAARRESRHDRMLAVSDLGLRFELAGELREAWEQRLKEARGELEKRVWEPIGFARGTLLSGEYEKAAYEFGRQLTILPSETDAARAARIYQQQAYIGRELKHAAGNADVRPTLEWQAFNRAVAGLINRRWGEAQLAIAEAIRYRPEAASWPAVRWLEDLVQAGQLVQEAVALSAQAEPCREDAGRDDWTSLEERSLALLQQAVMRLQEAVRKAPAESDFNERLQTTLARLDLRRDLLRRYQTLDELIRQAQGTLVKAREARQRGDVAQAGGLFAEAAQNYQEILAEARMIQARDPGQYRAQYLTNARQREGEEAEAARDELNRYQEVQRLAGEALAQARQALDLADYETAERYARSAYEQLPEREDIKTLRIVTQVAATLTNSMRGYLGTARAYFQQRDVKDAAGCNLNAALEWVNKTTGWREELRKQLEGSLPPALAEYPYPLPAVVAREVQTLTEVIRYTKTIYSQVQRSYLEGEYDQVCRGLRNLEEYLASWNWGPADSERARMEEAETFEACLKAVREGLQSPLSFETVRTHWLNLRGGAGRAAGQLRRRLGEAWRSLCEESPDLGEARRRALEGQELLREGVPDLADSLGRLAEKYSIGLAVADELALQAGGALYPSWFSQDARMTVRLNQLQESLEEISELSAPALLREQGAFWRRQLGEMLSAYLKGGLERIAPLLYTDPPNYREALAQAESLGALIPAELQSLIAPAVGREGIQRLSADLRVRLDLEKALTDLAVQVAARTLSFTQANERVAQLPQLAGDSKVPGADLQEMLKDLAQAARIEAELAHPPTVETYALWVAARWELLAEVSFPAERASWKWHARAGELVEQARDGLNKTVTALDQALQAAVHQVRLTARTAGGDLLPLYWQVRGVEVFLRERQYDLPEGLAGLEAALQLPEELAARVKSTLLKLESRADLESASDILEVLRELNVGLAVLPQVEGHPIVALPAGVVFPKIEFPLSSAELKGLAEVLACFGELGSDPPVTGNPPAGEPAGVGGYDAGAVSRAEGKLQRVQDRLTELRQTIWPGLWKNTPPWPETSAPALLEKGVAAHLQLAGDLQRFAEIADRAPMQGLALLDQQGVSALQTVQTGAHWLVAPEHKILERAFAALRRELISALGRQVAQILEDQATAVTSLREQLLGLPESEEVALAVVEAVRKGISERAEAALKNGRRDQARQLWRLVIEAAAPWSDGPSGEAIAMGRVPEVAQVWYQLHTEATLAYANLAPSLNRKWVAAAVVTALLLLIGGGWGINAFYFDPREAARLATATAQAGMLAAEARWTRIALNATATAEALALDINAQGTATAQAATATAVYAAGQQGLSATATAQAQAFQCRIPENYAFVAAGDPEILPKPESHYVIGDSLPVLKATWTLTNTGICPWNTIVLQSLNGGRQEAQKISEIQPGQASRVNVSYTPQGTYSVDEVWVVQINGVGRLDWPTLKVKVDRWAVAVKPTFTPTPTPTATATPTPTPEPVNPGPGPSGPPATQGPQKEN